jgi:hypothetical protein
MAEQILRLYCAPTHDKREPGSSVNTVSDYGTDDRGSIPARSRALLL